MLSEYRQSIESSSSLRYTNTKSSSMAANTQPVTLCLVMLQVIGGFLPVNVVVK